jgi:hypothetical protein
LKTHARLALVLSALSPLSCSSTSAPGPQPGGTATFSAVYQNVFSVGSPGTSCIDHHSGGTSAAGSLDMSSQKLAYQNLVGVPAAGPLCGPAGLDGGTPEIRVVAGSSASSLLYQKLSEAQPACGGEMPALGMQISPDQLALVKSWIDEGAPND